MTPRTPRIDVHAHMMEREAAAAGVPHSVVTAFGARKMPPAAPGSAQEMAERAGFEGFFRFTAAHPALYRVVREAEFVSPEMLRLHYTRIVDGYEAGLRAAQRDGDVDDALDPEVTAWALMGAGELIGMRFLLWERDEAGDPPAAMPEQVIDGMMRFIRNALAVRRRQSAEGPQNTEGEADA